MLLKELPLKSGRVTLADGSILSYASQEPWLFSGTVRENILFGQEFNRQRYKQVYDQLLNIYYFILRFEFLLGGEKMFSCTRL